MTYHEYAPAQADQERLFKAPEVKIMWRRTLVVGWGVLGDLMTEGWVMGWVTRFFYS